MRAYLAGGGNAFFMLDPVRARPGSSPCSASTAIVVDDDIVIDEASHFWADVSSPAVSDYNRHQVTRELPLAFFPGVRSLSPTPRARARHLRACRSSTRPSSSWGQANPRPRRASSRAATSRARHADGRRPAAAGGDDGAATAGRRSRIAVVGDSDFATNSFFHIMGNGTLFLNTVNYLAAQENLIGIQPRTPTCRGSTSRTGR